jgi:precorrin-6B methylase 2
MKKLTLLLSICVSGVAFGQTDTTYKYLQGTPDGTGKYYMGREIAQVMGPGGIDWLERPERQSEENARLAIAKMGLAPNAVVADIGAGSGYYTFRIAARLPQGKVYAVEVQNAMIDYLNKKKVQSKAANVYIIKGDSENVHLPASSVDLAIMVDVYHELSWPKEILRSIYNSLKPSGKILLIEYRGEDPAVAIKPLHKTTAAQINRELGANGFVPYYTGEFLPIQHFFLFRKRK